MLVISPLTVVVVPSTLVIVPLTVVVVPWRLVVAPLTVVVVPSISIELPAVSFALFWAEEAKSAELMFSLLEAFTSMSADELNEALPVLSMVNVPWAWCWVSFVDLQVMLSALTVKFLQATVMLSEVWVMVLVSCWPLQVRVMAVPSKVAVWVMLPSLLATVRVIPVVWFNSTRQTKAIFSFPFLVAGFARRWCHRKIAAIPYRCLGYAELAIPACHRHRYA